MRKRNRLLFDLFVPVFFTIIIITLHYAGVLRFVENNAFDLLLSFKSDSVTDKSANSFRDPVTDQSILIIPVSGSKISETGKRLPDCSTFSKSLILLRELGADYSLIGFDWSDEYYKNPLACADLETGARISAGTFVSLVPENFDTKAGNNNEDLRKIATDIAASGKIEAMTKNIETARYFTVPPARLIRNSKGAGFAGGGKGPYLGLDGFALVLEYDHRYIPHLGLSVLLDIADPTGVMVRDEGIAIRGFRSDTGKIFPGLAQAKQDEFVIPLSENGTFIIGISAKKLKTGFRFLGYQRLADFIGAGQKLEKTLLEMNEKNYFTYYRKAKDVFTALSDAGRILADLGEASQSAGIGKYRSVREIFLEETTKLLSSEAETDMISDAKERISRRGSLATMESDIASRFGEARKLAAFIAKERTDLKRELAGSICIFTDDPIESAVKESIAKQPRTLKNYDARMPDAFITAGIISTIRSGRFVRAFPYWSSLAVVLLLAICAVLIVRQPNLIPSLFTGAGIAVILVICSAAFFVFTGYYWEMISLASVVLLSSFTVAFASYGRKAYSLSRIASSGCQRLSENTIRQLISEPQTLSMPGEKKTLSVISSGIKGFATIVSKTEPALLVGLLREYHREMNDVILNLDGSIDRYGSDEIFAFFGAPVAQNDHTLRASRAALRMKNMSHSLSKHFTGSKICSYPVSIKIGINSGEMIAGNIGDPGKPDFAVLGEGVDLAVNLANVNSFYGSSVLVTETVFRHIKDAFTIRQLDRMRFGKGAKPVRIYELIDEKDTTSPRITEFLEFYHDALYLFEKREWRKSLDRFEKAQKMNPTDPACKLYLKRCRTYAKKPPLPGWDGVFRFTPG